MKLLLIMTALFSWSSFAGSGKGNGGDAVVCFEDPQTRDEVANIIWQNEKKGLLDDPFENVDFDKITVELLDLYFAAREGLFEIKDNVLIDTGDMKATEIVDERLAILKEKTNYYSKLTSTIKNKTGEDYWREIPMGLVNIPDSRHIVQFPHNCLLIQIAYRKDNLIYYDSRLYSKMSELHKAALYIHEAVYALAIAIAEKEHTDSSNTRDFIAYMFSQEFANAPGKEVAKRILDLTLEEDPLIYYFKRNILDEEIDFESNFFSKGHLITVGSSLLSRAHLRYDQVIQGYPMKAGNLENVIRYKYAYGNQIEFFPDGQLKSGTLSKPYVIDNLLVSEEISFDSSGKLISGYLKEEAPLTSTEVNFIGPFKFYESGGLKYGHFAENTKINGFTFQEIEINHYPQFEIENRVNFYENGEVKSGSLVKGSRINKLTPFPEPLHVTFGRTGNIKEVFTPHNSKGHKMKWDGIHLEPSTKVSFHSNGILSSGFLKSGKSFRRKTPSTVFKKKCKASKRNGVRQFELDDQGRLIRCGDKTY